jgi:repressor LexA
MNYIGEYIRKYRGEMSLREFADKCGISHTHLDSIEKGYDPRTGKPVRVTVDTLKKIAKTMGMTINDLLIQSGDVKISDLQFDNAEFADISSDTIQIPVLGTIKAGIEIEAQQDIIEYIDIPKEWTKGNKKFYGLQISGDSMFPKYQEKDIVIFEQTNDYTIANKKDCAVMVNGFDATFKNITISESGITLVPLNINNSDNYQPTFYNKEQIEKLPVKIIGIAREKRTKL